MCLDGCHMWNRCAEMEEIMSFGFPFVIRVMCSHAGRVRTVATVVPCLFFPRQHHESHSTDAAAHMHHNALYRCTSVTADYSTVLTAGVSHHNTHITVGARMFSSTWFTVRTDWLERVKRWPSRVWELKAVTAAHFTLNIYSLWWLLKASVW